MKLLVIGDEKRTKKFLPDIDLVNRVDVVVAPRGADDDTILDVARDADFIMADAISPVSACLISKMPNLKLIHSEGVAFDKIDINAAKRAGVAVCNNAGVNAGAVAEQTILLMLACLRDTICGHGAVKAGLQIETKERKMVEGIRELADCTVGFVGFGTIAQATAKRLNTWGCTMLYNKRTRLEVSQETALNVEFRELDALIAESDIVSIHLPVTDQTRGMVNEEFLRKMKSDAILINTARGEIIDQPALCDALEQDVIAMAGLDVLSPEPVRLDNPLLNLSDHAARKLVLSPHIGGITEGMFRRAHGGVWENIGRYLDGEPLANRVC